MAHSAAAAGLLGEVGSSTLLRMLYHMKLHRAIEDRLEVVYRQGKLRR